MSDIHLGTSDSSSSNLSIVSGGREDVLYGGLSLSADYNKRTSINLYSGYTDLFQDTIQIINEGRPSLTINKYGDFYFHGNKASGLRYLNIKKFHCEDVTCKIFNSDEVSSHIGNFSRLYINGAEFNGNTNGLELGDWTIISSDPKLDFKYSDDVKISFDDTGGIRFTKFETDHYIVVEEENVHGYFDLVFYYKAIPSNIEMMRIEATV